MNSLEQNLPSCSVVVRKLSLEDISRMIINPFYVKYKCGRCKKPVHQGPKCVSCNTIFHFNCGVLRRMCCGLNIVTTPEPSPESLCPKCKCFVQFGPQCSICNSMFHSLCVSPYEICCQLNLFTDKKPPEECSMCVTPVKFGPKCPLCRRVYHPTCVGDNLTCCGVKFTHDDETNYKCRKCNKKLSLIAPMCMYCGRMKHGYCLSQKKNCCGRRMSLEVYIIPSFKFLSQYNTQFTRKRAMLKKLEEMVYNHDHNLRDRALSRKKRPSLEISNVFEAHNHVMDCTTTTEDVKIEVEEKDVDIEDFGPPILERETYSPEPSSSVQMPDITEKEDSLKNLFDFLYKMVKKFPPNVQTQVKIDLFKVVTEAEMRCEVLPSTL